jgi:hypothetical protein
MRRLGIGFVVSLSALCSCSDDGVPADTDSQTQADDGGTADDSATSPTATADPSETATDPSAGSETLDDGPGTSDGTGAPTTGTTADGTDDDTSGTETGPGPGDACVTEADCVVVDDCCNCLAIPADEEPPECDIMACLQSTCMAMSVPPIAVCELGHCELAPVPCNPSNVFCESLPPDCPDGTLPGVNPDANCWAGTCVPAEACDVVPACSDCPEDEACVAYETLGGPQYHCYPVPAACDGTPSCACMAEACMDEFDTCNDMGMGISCSCPTC